MSIKDGRQYGKTASEVYSVDPKIISLRLNDGTYIGAKLGLVEELGKKRQMASGETPLEYTPQNMERIKAKSWNPRVDYGDVEDLKAKIKAAGRIKEPLELIADGAYLALKKGHRRHLCLYLLRQEGIIIEEVPATIIKIGAGVSIEDLELDFWTDNTQKPFTYYEKAIIIKRYLNRGFNKQEFCNSVGCNMQEIDMIMAVAGQPEVIRNFIDSGAIAPTTLKIALSEARKLDWTEQELTAALEAAVANANDNGKAKATQDVVIKTIIKKSKEKGDVVPNRKPTNKIKIEAFDDLIGNARKIGGDQNSVIIAIPADLWNEYKDILEGLSE
jgi:hypothetical protein